VCGIAALALVGAVAAGPRSSDDLERTVSAWAAVGSGSVAARVDPVVPSSEQPVSAPRGGDATGRLDERPPTAASGTSALGEERVLGGVLVTVTSVRLLDRLGITGDGTRVVAELEVRRVGAGPALVPTVELVCTGARGTGNYYAESTVVPGRELDRGETVAGIVVLGLPSSVGSGRCSGAALRLVDPVPPTDDPTGLGPALEITLPEGVLAPA
jgi:hypothetical protein